ncbi:MAG: hypothetical protein JWM92_252 [Candidatus Nomurabacteria bacterium]|jgi:hypothetical protein|nr:hypothetical protein [Candidatus Nomurabacteria bacterium]
MKKYILNLVTELEAVANYRGKKALIIGALAVVGGSVPALSALLS